MNCWSNEQIWNYNSIWTQDIDVEWAGHPNWFFRISKFSMPFIKSSLHSWMSVLAWNWNNSGRFGKLCAQAVVFLFRLRRGFSCYKIRHRWQSPTSEKAQFFVAAESQLQAHRSSSGWFGESRNSYSVHLGRWSAPTTFLHQSGPLKPGEMIGVKFNKNKTWVGRSVLLFEVILKHSTTPFRFQSPLLLDPTFRFIRCGSIVKFLFHLPEFCCGGIDHCGQNQNDPVSSEIAITNVSVASLMPMADRCRKTKLRRQVIIFANRQHTAYPLIRPL